MHSLSPLALILLGSFVASSSTVAVSLVDDMATLLDTEGPTQERRGTIADESRLWREGKVNYTIDSDFTGEQSETFSSLSHRLVT